MSGKVKRFSTRLFVSWMIDNMQTLGKEYVVNDISDYILGTYQWVKQCEGKTKTQVTKMNYAYKDEWFE